MLIDQIKILEKLDDSQRFKLILEWMERDGLNPETDEYSTGHNIFSYGQTKIYNFLLEDQFVHQQKTNNNTKTTKIGLVCVFFFVPSHI